MSNCNKPDMISIVNTSKFASGLVNNDILPTLEIYGDSQSSNLSSILSTTF